MMVIEGVSSSENGGIPTYQKTMEHQHFLTGAFHVGNGWVAGGCWDYY